MTAGGSPRRRFDLSWRRGNVAALIVLCGIAAGLLIAELLISPTRPLDEYPSVSPDRVGAVAERINPNTASRASLRRLGGIGPTKANDIVAYRRAHPPAPFTQPADLQAVSGIGEGIARRLAPYLCFGEPASQPSRR